MAETIIDKFARAFDGPIETNRQVSTLTARDNISAAVRWEGMQVYVIDQNATYELRGGVTNADWQISGGFDEAPQDGKLYGRKNGAWDVLTNRDYVTENANVSGTYDVDFLLDTFLLTLTGDTTFTESGLPASGTASKVITLYVTGDFALTFPAAWTTNMVGQYVGTALNQIVVEYIKDGVYWVSIAQPDA